MMPRWHNSIQRMMMGISAVRGKQATIARRNLRLLVRLWSHTVPLESLQVVEVLKEGVDGEELGFALVLIQRLPVAIM